MWAAHRFELKDDIERDGFVVVDVAETDEGHTATVVVTAETDIRQPDGNRLMVRRRYTAATVPELIDAVAEDDTAMQYYNARTLATHAGTTEWGTLMRFLARLASEQPHMESRLVVGSN